MEPKTADLVTPATFRIRWKDGLVTDYGARQLRIACPCAQCIEEWTGKKILDPGKVAESIILTGAELVGRYAFNFRWSDGHSTGIFTWEHLRRLASEAAGRPAQ